jgi:hypothetical protein
MPRSHVAHASTAVSPRSSSASAARASATSARECWSSRRREHAEAECLADEDLRARRREREQERRAGEDVKFQRDLGAKILRLFPNCPADRARAIAVHTGRRGSGRVGRTAAGRALHHEAVTLAVVAAVRHTDTPYDELLMSGVDRDEARWCIETEAEEILERWRAATA